MNLLRRCVQVVGELLITAGVLVLVSLGTVVGVKLTPNGVTEKQVAEIEDYVGQHRAE